MARIGIYAPPGARCGFVATYLNQKLTTSGYDIGRELNYASGDLDFIKTHTYDEKIHDNDITIRINLSYDLLDRMLYLFLHKNIYRWEPNFTKDEYGIDTFTKLYYQAVNEIKEEQAIIDNNYKFDITLSFAETYSVGYLSQLYRDINGKDPTQQEKQNAILTNQQSIPDIDVNHASHIVKFIINIEKELNLNESNRKWSINKIYEDTQVKELYNKVNQAIKSNNYF